MALVEPPIRWSAPIPTCITCAHSVQVYPGKLKPSYLACRESRVNLRWGGEYGMAACLGVKSFKSEVPPLVSCTVERAPWKLFQPHRLCGQAGFLWEAKKDLSPTVLPKSSSEEKP